MNLIIRMKTFIRKSSRAFVIFLFSIILCPLQISDGQTTNDVDNEFQGTEIPLAPVKIDGRKSFFVRGISSFPAEQRAVTISRRIKKAAADKTISPDSVKIINGPGYLAIYSGKEFIMNIYPADAEAEKVSQAALADLIHQRTSEA